MTQQTAPQFDAPASEWMVYADSLQQKGDPRGELIALVNSGDEAKRDAHVRQHGDALLGAAAKHFGSGLMLSWRWGFIDGATVRGSTAELVQEVVDTLLALPLAERLSKLTVVGVPNDDETVIDLSGVVQRLAESAPTTLATLELVDDRAANATSLTSRDFDPGENLVNYGSLEALWAMPGLRSLKLVMADTRQLETGDIEAPSLESLTIHGLRLAGQAYGDDANTSDVATALGEAKLPKLKSFDMRLCEEWTVNYVDDVGAYTSFDQDIDEYGDGMDDGYSEGANWAGEFGDALKNLVQSPLERLALTNFASTASLLELIKSTGLPPTLKELDLSDSSLASEDVAWFTANKGLFAKLERLVLKNTGFTADDVKALEELGPKVEHSHRAAPVAMTYDDEGNEVADIEAAEEGGNRPLPRYRYIVGME